MESNKTTSARSTASSGVKKAAGETQGKPKECNNPSPKLKLQYAASAKLTPCTRRTGLQMGTITEGLQIKPHELCCFNLCRKVEPCKGLAQSDNHILIKHLMSSQLVQFHTMTRHTMVWHSMTWHVMTCHDMHCPERRGPT